MNNLQQLISEYLEYCHYQKKLNQKTIKAYKIDLGQYYERVKDVDAAFKRNNITNYITDLHKGYKPKSVKRKAEGASEYQKKSAVRDVAVLELLFSTGLRVSELCSLKCCDLEAYQKFFQEDIQEGDFFFYNRLGNRLSEQSVRFMINRYADVAGLTEHITPHMFRHTFATLLLEEDVDIRYIQQILGHSSIMTTQIYTHVTANKQKDILMAKNPRNKLNC